MTTFKKWLPWIIVAALLAFLWRMTRKPAAQAPESLTSKGPELPGSLGTGGVFYFPGRSTSNKPGDRRLRAVPTNSGPRLPGKSTFAAPPPKPKTTVGSGGVV